jgi:uncharacterized protein (TIGR03437 family)
MTGFTEACARWIRSAAPSRATGGRGRSGVRDLALWKGNAYAIYMRLPAVFILSIAGWLSLAIPVSAQPRIGGTLNCSAATLTGTYGYAVSGFEGTTPAANYGFFTADGAGNFSGSGTVSYGGAIVSGSFTAKYTLGTNCTGAAVFTNAAGIVTHLNMTVNANGAVIDFVQTDSGATVSGTAQPVAPSCAVNAFSGPYTYAISGWIYVSGVPVPYADAGRLVADGNGNFTGKSTFSAGGEIFRRTLTGTYTVNAGCAGTVALSDSLGNTGTLAMTLVNSGQQALFLNTTPNTVVTGHIYRGQNTCSNSTLSGSYVYSVSGFGVAPGVLVPAAYSGTATANGSGSITGSDYISNANGDGVVVPRTTTATYTVNSDCSGSEVVKDSLGETEDLDFFVADQGALVEFIQTNSGLVISGQAQSLPSGTCSNATTSGSYGYAVEGWLLPPLVSELAADAAAGQFTADGAGHFSGADTVSFGGTIENRTITGTYQINSNCTGSYIFQDSLGNVAHFQLVVSPNGQQLSAIETDSDTVIASFTQYQITQASAAVVNAGSFSTNVAPGSLISIFGSGFASSAQTAQAGVVWPTQLGTTTVLVNGTPIPLFYVNPNQIDAQLPVNLAPGSAQLTVEAGGASSAAASFTVSAGAPGVFTYGPLRAVAYDFSSNPNGVLVGPSVPGLSSPALPGDQLVVYLTGGGAVSTTSGTWATDTLAPSGLSRVSAPYSVSIGGLPASVAYYGLTAGFIGLYQLNVQVPALPPGDQTLVITENGVPSASTLITVAP